MTFTLEHDYIGIGLALPDSSSTPSDLGSSSSSSSSTVVNSDSDLKTELRLGLPGSESPPALTLSISTPRGSKRGFSDAIVDNSNKWVFSANPNKPGSDPEPASDTKDDEKKKKQLEENAAPVAPAAKAQVVGWPPIRSYRKNTLATNNANPSKKEEEDAEAKQGSGRLYVKISMDGAPYLRKVDLKVYSNYKELSLALQKMFSCFTIGQCGSHGIPAGDGKLTDHGSENVLTYEDKYGDWMLVGDVPWDMFTETCRRLRIMKDSDAIGLAPRAAGKVKNQN